MPKNSTLQKRSKSSSLAIPLFRLLISVGLLVWILSGLNLANLVTTILSANYWFFLFGLFIFQLGVILRTLRWRQLLEGFGIFLPFSKLVILNYSGTFFNTFLPTGFGGDFIKTVELGRISGEQIEKSVDTVLLDRLSGLTALVFLSILALPIAIRYLTSELLYVLSIVIAIVVAINIFIYKDGILEKLIEFMRGKLGGNLINRFLIPITQTERKFFWRAWLISLLFSFLIIVTHFALSRAIQSEIPFSVFAILTPLVSLSLLVPSIQGLGVREAVYGLLLVELGYGNEMGILLGVSIFTVNILTAIIGGIVYLWFSLNRISAKGRIRNDER